MASLFFSPIYQALLFLGLTIVTLLVARPQSQETLWIISGILYILFMTANSIILCWQDRPWLYVLYSLLISVGYIFITQFITTGFIKSLNLTDSGESSMIFLVIIYHPVALLLVMFVKWIYLKIF